MKKIFTLIAVAMMAINVCAGEEDILSGFSYTWNGDETFSTNADGTVTFNAVQWGGFASWIGGKDWSQYEKLVVEFAEATPVTTQILILPLNYAVQAPAGSTELIVPFEGQDMSNVEQVALQCADAGTIVLKRIYLVEGGSVTPIERDSYETNATFWKHEWQTSEEAYDGPAEADADGVISVYVRSEAQAQAAGNMTIDQWNGDKFAEWDSQFFISWDPSLALKGGDKVQLKMQVKAEKAANVATQLHEAPGTYIGNLGSVDFGTDWSEYDSGVQNGMANAYTIALNLSKGDEVVYSFKDIQVILTIPTATGIEKKVIDVKPASLVRYNLAGQQVDASYKGVVIQNGKKMIVK